LKRKRSGKKWRRGRKNRPKKQSDRRTRRRRRKKMKNQLTSQKRHILKRSRNWNSPRNLGRRKSRSKGSRSNWRTLLAWKRTANWWNKPKEPINRKETCSKSLPNSINSNSISLPLKRNQKIQLQRQPKKMWNTKNPSSKK
jgi:hypothetical protein